MGKGKLNSCTFEEEENPAYAYRMTFCELSSESAKKKKKVCTFTVVAH